MATEIVIAGGGYTGVWAARAITRAARAGAIDGVRVRLVSAALDHSFHGWTAEVITGHVRADRARVPLTRLLPGVEIISGSVTAVRADERIEHERSLAQILLPFGSLVVHEGIGAHAHYQQRGNDTAVFLDLGLMMREIVDRMGDFFDKFIVLDLFA